MANEVQKNGIDKENLESFLINCKMNFDLDIIGLMCIPPNDGNTECILNKCTILIKSLDLMN